MAQSQLDFLYDKWCTSMDDIDDIYDMLEMPRESSLEDVNKEFETINDQVHELYSILIKEHLIDKENKIKINKVFESLHYCRISSNGFYHSKKITSEHTNLSDDHSLYKFQALDYDQLKPNQKMILFVMNRFKDENFKRYNDCCYKMIKNPEGYDTYAWEKVDTIANVVYNTLSKRVNMNMFLMSIQTRDSFKFVIDHMMKCDDSTFPPLIKDRHVFSFQNGLYVAYNKEHDIVDKFYEYNDPNIPHNLTSCKYFDVILNNPHEQNPENVETPLLDKILLHQNLPNDVIIWNKVYLGRLLYDNNEVDNWQTIMFYLGKGGTGKSTINNDIAKQFYDIDDVAVMSNNIQKKFGLSDIYDKFIFIAPEIKKDWCIEQAEFQEIVSGGDININIKYKQSETKKWTTPGLLGGNENPDFIDNSGSVKRRIVVTRFDKKVTKGDAMLGKKLRKELPYIIKQCNMYYHKYVAIVGTDTVWDHLPNYFKETQAKMSDATNSLSNFLNSGKLTFGQDLYMPKDIFLSRYKEHCNEYNFKVSKITIDFLNTYFEDYQIEEIKREPRHYDGRQKMANWLIGVDLVKDLESTESENEFDKF